MKQIFDWMRKKPLKAFEVYDGSIGVYPCEVNRLIDEAEAKWETEHKPYNVEKVVEQIKDYFFKVIVNCEEENISHEILEYNKAICDIVRRGGVE